MLHLRAVQSAWRSGLHETTNGIFGTGKKDLLFASLDFTRDVIAKYERIGNKYKTDWERQSLEEVWRKWPLNAAWIAAAI